MREKKPQLFVTFHTTAAAMAFEKRCHAENIGGRLLPTPRALSADCSIAWCASPDDRSAIESLAEGLAIEQITELSV